MRLLALAAMLSLAVAPAALAKEQCHDAHGKPAACAPPVNPLRHPICVDSKPCHNTCIARYKICPK